MGSRGIDLITEVSYASSRCAVGPGYCFRTQLPGFWGFSAAGADKGTGTVQAEHSARSAVISRLALETTQCYLQDRACFLGAAQRCLYCF